MTTQITVSAAGVSKVGKSIIDAAAIQQALEGIYRKPYVRKGEDKLTARIRLAVTDDILTPGEVHALQMEVVN